MVVFWQRGAMVYFDAVTGVRRTLPAAAVPLLDVLGEWRSAADLRAGDPGLGSVREIASLLKRMQRFGLVQREDLARPWPWADWSPEAAFFHFGTRDADYPADFLVHEEGLRRKAQTVPQPPPTKSVRGRRVDLPPANAGDLGRVLLERRTWRSLSGRSIPLSALATLLGLTFGVHRRGRVAGQGEVVFKTSPSGGARHPIEAYVIARKVSGLPAAVYHYDAAAHGLVRVAPALQQKQFVSLLANQFYFGNCSAAIVMTACVERTMWRYPFSRAYRSILIEAGHLGQTFCLLATKLGLAPFTTIAFRDTQLESHLRIDGAAESAMYVVGVGSRLRGAEDRPGRIPGRD